MNQRFGRLALKGSLLAIMRTLFAVSIALAASGDLDTGFSGDGLQNTDFASGWHDEIRGIALQSDGKIVAVGQRYDPANANGKSHNFAVARYLTNGNLDTTFSGDGRLTTNFGAADTAYDVAIQPDGRIVVVGNKCTSTNACDLALARYKPKGALDLTFSGDGRKTVDFGGGHNGTFGGVVIQPDGKIVVAGFMWNGTDYDFAVYRLMPRGGLDSTFSGDGRQSIGFGAGRNDQAYDLALQGSNIVVTGLTCDSNWVNCDVAVAQLTSTGDLDSSFSGDGILTTDFGAEDFAYAVGIQSDNKIVVAGESYSSGADVFAVARYDTAGNLDSTFSGDGLQTVAFGTYAWANSLVIQGDQKIVVAGTTEGSAAQDFALVRLGTDGTPDSSFSGDGKVQIDFGSSSDYTEALAVQGDGKYVLGGVTNVGGQWDFALARVLP